jgi:O-antigen ligase
MDTHPIATVFFVYLMAFPFASVSDDSNNVGIKWIGGMFLAASLVLVVYTAALLTNLVPESLQQNIFWDGTRLHVFWHPNISACFFMIGMGFAAAFLAQAEKTAAKGLLAAVIVLEFAAMALTNCRTTLLMTGALLGGIAFFLISKGGWKRFALGLLAALVLLVGTFKVSGEIYRWNNDRLVEEYIQTQEQSEMPVPEEEGVVLEGANGQGTLSEDMRTLNNRTYIWEAAFRAVRDSKSLALFGTEYSGTVISVYHWFDVIHGHNSWIEVMMRMGIPGLLMSLVFTVLAVFSAAKLLFSPVELWKKIIAMLTVCVLSTGFLEPYLFITNVYYHILDFVFFFCTGYLDYWCRPGQQTE